MKSQVVQSLLYSSLLLFGVILVMIVAGMTAYAFGAGNSFFCGIFCDIGKILLALALLTIIVQTFRAFRTN